MYQILTDTTLLTELFGIMRTGYDCRLWKAEEWDNEMNYVIIKYYIKDGEAYSSCLQRLIDFTNLEILSDYNIEWENKGCEELGEIHGRCCEQDDKTFWSFYQLMELLDGEGRYDGIVCMPRDNEGYDGPNLKSWDDSKEMNDKPSEICLIWDTDFRKELAVNKITVGINDASKMGGAWSIDHREDGTTACVFVAVSDEEFEEVKNRVESWKLKDRLAYSRAEYIDNRKIVTHSKGGTWKAKAGPDDADQNSSTAVIPMANKRALWGDIENVKEIGDHVQPLNSLKELKHDLEGHPLKFHPSEYKAKKRYYDNKKREAKKKESAYKNEEIDDSKIVVAVKRARRPKYPNLPPEPESDFMKKCEKIFQPTIYAKRHDLYDKREKGKYHAEWEAAKDRLWRPISNGLEKSNSGIKFMPLGDGSFYNGYYTIDKRDFYHDWGDGEPMRIVRYWGCIDPRYRDDDRHYSFPEWNMYYNWYWYSGVGGGCAGLHLDRDPGYDSDGCTIPGAYDNSDFYATSSDGDIGGGSCAPMGGSRSTADKGSESSRPITGSNSSDDSDSSSSSFGRITGSIRKCAKCLGLKVKKEMAKLQQSYQKGTLTTEDLVESPYCHCRAWPKEEVKPNAGVYSSSGMDKQGVSGMQSDDGDDDLLEPKSGDTGTRAKDGESESDNEVVVHRSKKRTRRVLFDLDSE